MCVGVCERLRVCVRERKRVREMALSSSYSPTHNHGWRILDNLSYSLFHRPWIPKREKTKRKMQTAGQPPQVLFTRSHNLLALTDYPHITGPNISLWQHVLRTASLSLDPSSALTLLLCLFLSFMASRECKQFHISIRQRSGGFNIRFDREHK